LKFSYKLQEKSKQREKRKGKKKNVNKIGNAPIDKLKTAKHHKNGSFK
jgi:hypothetical protein